MSEELWYVKLANGDVHRVTLDQLDGAFQAGHIDESTMVLAAGATQWTKLGDLAGLDDDAAPAAPPDPQPQYVAPAPAPIRAAPVAQATYVAPVRSAYAAPVQAPAHLAPARAPAAYAAPASVAPSYAANSLRPMSMDLGDAADYDMPFRRKSRTGWVVAVLGLLVVAGGGSVAANRSHLDLASFGIGGKSDLANAAAAAALAAPPPPAADPVVAAPPPTPAPAAAPAPATPAANAAPADGSPLNPQFTTRLNEDTKQKLLAADKSHDQKSKARHAGGGAVHSGGSSKAKSTTFTTGGNKYDPLNSSI
jgi:hypothetical protein